MANVFDNAVKGYTIGLNNKLNAQKAYIDSYITGINARNAVNQEARTKDQYWNYTQPFQASNLGITLGQNNIQQRILNDPNYQNDLFGVATSKASQANQLATADLNNMGYYIDTQGNLAKTGALTSGYNAKEAKFNLSQQDAVNKQKAAAIAHSGVMQPIQNQTALEQAQQYYKNLTNPIIEGATSTNGTPTTIMLPNGGTTPTGMFGTDGRFNFTGTTTTPASGLPSNQYNTQPNQYGGDLVDLNSSVQIMQPTVQQNQQQIPLPTGQQTGQVNLNSNPFYQNYSADQLQSALGNLTSSTDSILGSTPDIFLSPERRARKIAFNQNYERMIQARDAKIAEQKAQQQIENQAYLKRLTDKALERQRTNSGLK